MKLSDIKVRNLKAQEKAYKLFDGEGLYIHVTPKGSKLWRMSYRSDGKQKTLSFGKYPQVSLQRAREKRLDAKRLLADGIDPMEHARAEEAESSAKNEHTFEKIALEYLEKSVKDGNAEATMKKKRWYCRMACDEFGKMPIREITAPIVLSAIRKQEDAGNGETAHKLRTFVGQVFRYAVATGKAESDPTFALRGALVSHKKTHMAALVERDDFAALVKAVWNYQGGGPSIRAALKLMVLLYPRPGELRFSTWSEFDLEKAIWTIPAERMKMRREHKKPLSKLAVEILTELKPFTGDAPLAFPSLIARAKPLSENTLNQSLRRMGFDKTEATSHGFRSSASSLLNESNLWNPDAIEAELAHKVRDQIRGAYMRTPFWDERVRMAEWWSEQVQGMAGLSVSGAF